MSVNRLIKKDVDLILPSCATAICSELFPRAIRNGQHLRAGDMTGSKGMSFAIVTSGTKAGQWFDHSTGESGDLYSLLQQRMGFSFAEAVEWLADRTGVSSSGMTEATRDKVVRAAAFHQKRVEREETEGNRKTNLRAIKLWGDAVAAYGTPAQDYLTGRGLDLPREDQAWSAMRFHPACPYDQDGMVFPALLFEVTDARDHQTFVGVHRIFLKTPPRGVRKKRLGKISGAHPVIRLSDDAEVTYGLGIAEGPETALAIHSRGWRPVWSAIDANGIENFPTINGLHSLTIFADNDSHKTDRGREATRKCALRWRDAGREVQAFMPNKPGDDFLDFLGGA